MLRFVSCSSRVEGRGWRGGRRRMLHDRELAMVLVRMIRVMRRVEIPKLELLRERCGAVKGQELGREMLHEVFLTRLPGIF